MTEYKRWLPIILFSIFLFIMYNLNRFYKTEHFDYSPFHLSGSGIQITFNQDECLDDLSWISQDKSVTCPTLSEGDPRCNFVDVNGFTGFEKCPRSCDNCQDQLFPGDSANDAMLSAPDALYDNETGEMMGQVRQGGEMTMGGSTMATFSDKRLYEIEEEFKEKLESMEESISELLGSVYDDILLAVAENRNQLPVCLRDFNTDVTQPQDSDKHIPGGCGEDELHEDGYGAKICYRSDEECGICVSEEDGACVDGTTNMNIINSCNTVPDKVYFPDGDPNGIDFNYLTFDPPIETDSDEYQTQKKHGCTLVNNCINNSSDKFNIYKWISANDENIPNLGMMVDLNIKDATCYDLKKLNKFVGDTLNEDICSELIYTSSVNNGRIEWKTLYERCPIRCNDTCKSITLNTYDDVSNIEASIDVDLLKYNGLDDTNTNNYRLDSYTPNADTGEYEYISGNPTTQNNYEYLSFTGNENRDLIERFKYLLTLVE